MQRRQESYNDILVLELTPITTFDLMFGYYVDNKNIKEALKCDVAEKNRRMKGKAKKNEKRRLLRLLLLLQRDADKIFSLCIFVHCFMERMSQQAVKTEPFDCQYAAWIVYVQLGGWLSILHLWAFAHRLSLLFPSFFFLIALKDEPSFCDRCGAFLPGNPRAASKDLLFIFLALKHLRGGVCPHGHVQDVSVSSRQIQCFAPSPHP